MNVQFLNVLSRMVQQRGLTYLAIKLGIHAFKVYLLGRSFQVQTDHWALVWLNSVKDKTSRLTRWSIALQPFDFTIVHRVGRANANADALSRILSSST